jgi:hypothetical protein
LEAVHQLLRHTFEGPANRCSGQVLEGDAAIAMSGKLGIEGNGPETGDFED